MDRIWSKRVLEIEYVAAVIGFMNINSFVIRSSALYREMLSELIPIRLVRNSILLAIKTGQWTIICVTRKHSIKAVALSSPTKDTHRQFRHLA